MIQSGKLSAFYKDLSDWITNGLHEFNDYILTDTVGICNNLQNWAISKDYSYPEQAILDDELINQFKSEGLSTETPFNTDFDEYVKESLSKTLYSNPARLAWIKSHTPPTI